MTDAASKPTLTPADGASPPVPPLVGRLCRLEAASPPYYTALYQLMLSDEVWSRYRYRSRLPTLDQFGQELFAHNLASFVVLPRTADDLIGFVAIADPDYRNGVASLDVAGFRAFHGTGVLIEATLLAVNFAFLLAPLRKLYAQVIEYNLPQFVSGSKRLFHVEGSLRRHEYVLGRYWDIHYVAIYRDDFFEYATPVLDLLNRAGARDSPPVS